MSKVQIKDLYYLDKETKNLVAEHKRAAITHDMIKQFETPTDLTLEGEINYWAKMWDKYTLQDCALFKTLYNQYYLFYLPEEKLYKLTKEVFDYCKSLGTWNLCMSEQHVLDVVNNALENNEWTALAGSKQ